MLMHNYSLYNKYLRDIFFNNAFTLSSLLGTKMADRAGIRADRSRLFSLDATATLLSIVAPYQVCAKCTKVGRYDDEHTCVNVRGK